MKYLKTFENFDLGRFSEEDDNQSWMNNPQETEDTEDIQDERENDLEDEDDEYRREEEEYREEEENEGDPSRIWGDEVVEKKKINAGFQAYLDKKAGKKADKKEEKEEKDGDKKEPMKKAAKEKEEKSGKGLTTAQKKLPVGLQKAIAAKKK
jgi:hypothetical protein